MSIKPNIYRMKLASQRGMQIILDSIAEIDKSMSEIDIYNLLHKNFAKKPDWFAKEGVVSEDFSWEKEECPLVLSGKNIGGDCHAKPSTTIFNKGNTCVIDFGVKLIFSDGEEWVSDHQRVFYALRDNEISAPPQILYRFNILKKAIRNGIDKIKVGVKGFEVDRAVRNTLLSAGMPDYKHGTGHPVDKECHGKGTALTTLKSRPIEANLEVEEGRVYTIEPRVQLSNGISMEEMVVVYNDRIEPLVPLQEDIIYVRMK